MNVLRNWLLLTIFLMALFVITPPSTAFATNHQLADCSGEGDLIGLNCLNDSGLVGEQGPQDIRIIIVRLINISLGFLGIIATVVILWAGFKWMTAGGNSEEVEKARKIIFAAVIGLLIIMSAWAISRYALTELYRATTGQPYGGYKLF